MRPPPAPEVTVVLARHNGSRHLSEQLGALSRTAPMKIRTVLINTGRECTARAFGQRAKDASREHAFDARRQALGIQHRLTRPKHLQTNSMVESFNVRIARALNTHHSHSGEDLEQTLNSFVWLYSRRMPHKAFHHAAPLQALKRWQTSHPHFFSKQVRDRAGPES